MDERLVSIETAKSLAGGVLTVRLNLTDGASFTTSFMVGDCLRDIAGTLEALAHYIRDERRRDNGRPTL